MSDHIVAAERRSDQARGVAGRGMVTERSHRRGSLGRSQLLVKVAVVLVAAMPCRSSQIASVRVCPTNPTSAAASRTVSASSSSTWWQRPAVADALNDFDPALSLQSYDGPPGCDGQWNHAAEASGPQKCSQESNNHDSSSWGDWASSESGGLAVYSHSVVGTTSLGSKSGHGKLGKGKRRPKACQFEGGGCTKVPYFGDEGSRYALFCKQHKKPWQTNIVSKRCEQGGCAKRPVFGHPSFGVVRYCKEHKLENDIDLVNKRCVHSGCRKHPVFGVIEGTRALYCGEHASDDHVDVRHKKCAHSGCELLPSFGDAVSSSFPQYCKDHKLPGQVSLTRRRRESVGRFHSTTSSPSPSSSGDVSPTLPSLSPPPSLPLQTLDGRWSLGHPEGLATWA